MKPNVTKNLEKLAAAFALAAAACFGGLAYEQLQMSKQPVCENATAENHEDCARHRADALLYTISSTTFGAAGLIDLARRRRKRPPSRRMP